MSVEETLRRRRAKQAAPAEVPLIRPLRGTFSPSKAGEKGNAGGASIERGAALLLFPSPHAVGRRCPGGADEGLFSGKRDGSRGDALSSSCKASGGSRSPPHPPL